MSVEPAIDALLALEPDPQPASDSAALPAIGAYAQSVLDAAAGMFGPARIQTLRTGLAHIASECRRESATATTDDEENACQPR